VITREQAEQALACIRQQFKVCIDAGEPESGKEDGMGWVLHGAPWTDDGDHSPLQVGRAAHIRFRHADKVGRLLTVTAYPKAPEREIVTREGSVETFHGYEFDMGQLAVEAQTEFMICDDINDPGGTENWCDYRYKVLDVDPYTGSDDEKTRAAEGDALKYIRRFNGERDIDWDGERF
jgi:hypothetical protein